MNASRGRKRTSFPFYHRQEGFEIGFTLLPISIKTPMITREIFFKARLFQQRQLVLRDTNLPIIFMELARRKPAPDSQWRFS